MHFLAKFSLSANQKAVQFPTREIVQLTSFELKHPASAPPAPFPLVCLDLIRLVFRSFLEVLLHGGFKPFALTSPLLVRGPEHVSL